MFYKNGMISLTTEEMREIMHFASYPILSNGDDNPFDFRLARFREGLYREINDFIRLEDRKKEGYQLSLF